MLGGKPWSRLAALLLHKHRLFSLTFARYEEHCCRVVVVGGGTGGCIVASKLTNKLGKNKVIVIEPSDEHYYQSMFTLVGAGVKKLAESVRPTRKLLPKHALWLKDEVECFDPDHNTVCTKNGDQIHYDYMVVALGLQCNFDQIPGLQEGLDTPCSGVCSIYSPTYAHNTFKEFNVYPTRNAIFTHPGTPVKSPGASQKIMYMYEHHLRENCRRGGASVIFATALPVLYCAKTYSDALWKVVEKRKIHVNLSRRLVSIDIVEQIATFEDICKPGEKVECEFGLLHVTPPQSPPKVLSESKTGLVDSEGFLDLCKKTLRHTKYRNVFGVGDCTNLPTAKTAAAVVAQSTVVFHQLTGLMCGKSDHVPEYDGYTWCPLLTSYGTCILAEFDFDKNPLETFPFKQDKELSLPYNLCVKLLPWAYWNLILKGKVDGPETLRKILHMGCTR